MINICISRAVERNAWISRIQSVSKIYQNVVIGFMRFSKVVSLIPEQISGNGLGMVPENWAKTAKIFQQYWCRYRACCVVPS